MNFDIVFYDNTILSTWRSCLLKGYYRHHLHLTQDAKSRSAALDFGSAIHTALDHLYTHKDIEATQQHFITTYQPMLEALEQYDPRGLKKHSLGAGCTMLKSYWDYWYDSIMQMELLACEQHFQFDLGMNDDPSSCPKCQGSGHTLQFDSCPTCGGSGYVLGPFYCGKVDKVFRDTVSGQVVGMDHKTTSLLTGATISAFKISQQFRGYIYWLKVVSQWAEECGEYFYIDLLLKTKTIYNQDMDVLREFSNAPFYRDTVLAQPTFLTEWLDDTKKQITTIQHNIDEVRKGVNCHFVLPPQNSNACNDFNRLCQFYDLCSSPREYRATQAKQLYDIHQWNPLETSEEAGV